MLKVIPYLLDPSSILTIWTIVAGVQSKIKIEQDLITNELIYQLV